MKSTLYQNVVYFPQFIQPNEGEPMDSYIQKYKVQGGYKLKSNILWPEKDPKTGKTIRRHIGIKLDCWEHEKMKAYVKVGEILASLKNGIHPNAIKTKLKKLKPKFTNDDLESIWEVNILPWFGEYAIMEVTTKLLERYVEKRWGLSAKGEIQGKRDTFKKHMRSLKTAIHTVCPDWSVPEVKFKEIPKKRKQPIFVEDGIKAAPFVKAQSAKNGGKYLLAHWIMLYTALDILDAIQLAPDDIVREGTWISMDRSKSGVQIELPVVPQLARILSKVPRPIDSKRPYCAGIIRKNGAEATPKQASKNVSTAIKRAFSTSGKPGYTAKDLRRMLGAILLDQGYSREWIDKALTHAPGSRTTDAYMGVYDETLERAFKDAFGG